jgi:hypothetical protein
MFNYLLLLFLKSITGNHFLKEYLIFDEIVEDIFPKVDHLFESLFDVVQFV